VVSFDYDPSSVGCTTELRRRFYPDNPNWKISQGSVLDREFVASLGSFDVVYSWGVLHHTGQLWKAMDLAASMVAPNGRFFIGLYNDSHRAALYWLGVKKLYCKLPRLLKPLVLYPAALQIWGPRSVLELLQGRPFHSIRNYQKRRGMSPWHDVVDWVGGYPFEVSTPQQVFDFGRERGFALDTLRTTIGNGMNQFVFINSRA
jgi:SAM-dependent methyltransferase